MIPTFLIPIFFPFGADKSLPWYSRYAVKANFWIIPFNFVGNWFWTHYFFALLGAAYTFPVKYLWNEVRPRTTKGVDLEIFAEKILIFLIFLVPGAANVLFFDTNLLPNVFYIGLCRHSSFRAAS
jgi:hypothetical protein